MKISASICASVFALVLLSPSMKAAPIVTTDNQNLPGGTGFYNGTGNPDGHFVNMLVPYADGSITASLRLGQRFIGPITPTVDNDYACTAGESCNVEFSIWTDGGLHLSDFTYGLLITDLTTGHFLNIDPSTIQDNAYWTTNVGGAEFDDTSNTIQPDLHNYVGMENSEYLGFTSISTALGGWNPTDKLLVTLSVDRADHTGADPQVNMTVNANAVPEPASVGLIGLGLLGLGLMRRKINS